MTLTKPVVVPFEGPLTKGNFVRRTDRFTAHLVLDGIEVSDESNGEVKAHCINPGRMEAFVDPGATIWARRAPEDGPKRKTDWTWELIERDGVICSTRCGKQISNAPTPSTRRRPRNRICSMAWRSYGIDATSSPHLHLLDGVEILRH